MATVTASYNWVSGETVTPTKLNATAAPTVVVADNEITTAKILDANVTNAKLASDIDASKLTTGTLPIARIADGAVTQVKLADGAVVQVLQKTESAHAGVTALIPFDDTVPTSTEGWEIMTQAITPQSNTNKVLASVSVFLNPNNAATHTVALFRGTTCVYATSASQTGQNYMTTVSFQFLDSPATASATTYSVRIGASVSQVVYINGQSTGRAFGATPKSSLTLMEIKAS
jgi:hypothetical protein